MKIQDMRTLDENQLAQAAQMLAEELPQGWVTRDEALCEINTRWRDEEDVLFLAAVEDEMVIGWGGILRQYDGKVYELHPLVVRRDRQRQGIGTMILTALSDAARERGGLTLWLGADDDKPGGETSLARVDLYDDLPRHISTFTPGSHQTAFYMKAGFKIIGVMPDANGLGMPDILLGKRL